jgi:hypothetical protein
MAVNAAANATGRQRPCLNPCAMNRASFLMRINLNKV